MDVVVSESAPYEGSSSPSCALFDQINFFLSILSALEACEKPNAEDLQRLLTMLPSNHLYSTHEKYPFLQSYIQSSKYEPSPSESLPHFLHQFKDYPSFLSAIAVNDQSSQLFEMTPEMTQLARQELTRVQPVAPCQTKMSLPMSLDELVKRCLQRSEDAPTFESQVTSILSSEEAPLEHSNLEPFSGGGGPKIENGFQPRIGCEQHTSYALDLGANVVRYLGEQCRKCVSSDPKIFNMRLRLAAVMQSFKVHHSFVLKTWQLRRRREMYLASKTARSAQVIAQRKVALKEREHREYIQALKAQDMDKYLEYVKSSKNSRIQELLRQTDFYLESIQKRMRIQQKATVDLVATQQQGESTTSDKAKPTRASKRLSKRQSSASVVEAVPVQATNVHQINKGISVETLKQPKLLVGGQLMPYQLIGVQFLVNLFEANLSGILADEMGLGKTVQTIAFLAHLAETKFVRGPHLIVVPLSTLPIWALEFNRWCPSFKVMEFRGSRPERREFASAIRHLDFDICLTTYDWILREKTVLSMPHWCCIIVDEGHRMKNIKSKFHVTLSEFQSTCRLLLTGTPLQNNLVELWALLNFLLPKIFTSSTDFEEWFEKPFKDMPGHEPIELTDDEKFLIINRLHSVLRPFLLRRIKEEVLEDLPEKREYVIRIQLSAWQKAVYDQISSKALRSETVDGKVTHRSYANTVVQLRKIVNHPYLFESEYFLNEDLYRVSGKFEVLDRMLPKLLHFRHKILIFCQMTQLMDILDDYLGFRQFPRCRLDGNTLLDDRREQTEKFNDPNNFETLIFILSTRAGGLGLNLQAADTVIIFDSDWNPHQDLQAQARAHRLGQQNEVRVFRLVTVSGIEEAVMSKAKHKLDIDEKIIQAGMFNERCTEEERQQRLRSLLFHKGDDFETQVTTPQELNSFMARTEEEADYFHQYDEEIFGAETLAAFEQRCAIIKGNSYRQSTARSELNRKSNSQKRLASPSSDKEPGQMTIKRATGSKISESGLLAPSRPTKMNEIMSFSSNEPYPSTRSFIQKKQKLASLMTEEELLIQSRRLMAPSEIPQRYSTPESPEPKSEDAEAMRFARKTKWQTLEKISTIGAFSDASFLRALQLLESGELSDLNSALTAARSRSQRRSKGSELGNFQGNTPENNPSSLESFSQSDVPSSSNLLSSPGMGSSEHKADNSEEPAFLVPDSQSETSKDDAGPLRSFSSPSSSQTGSDSFPLATAKKKS